jgi:ribosomal-protein-alanine N-acetyltransferase
VSTEGLAVAIEDMREEDLSAALDIDLAAFRPSEIGAGAEEPRAVRERQLREELARPWARLRVARADGAIVVGYLSFWHVSDEVHLLNVAVAPPERRRGVGRSLVEDLLAYARAHRVARVLLEVRASNAAAIGLYESFGFERARVRAAYYADGEDAVEMMLGVLGA